VRAKEAEIQRKRGKVPGTPGVALQDGKGLVALAEVMVTWVCTDVADSTGLWEWNPGGWVSFSHGIRSGGVDTAAVESVGLTQAVGSIMQLIERLCLISWPTEHQGMLLSFTCPTLPGCAEW
jgi:hypothetical protein